MASAMKPQSFHLIPDMEKGYCMSVGVRAGDLLFIGGLFAVDDEGNALHPDDAAMQFKVVYEQMNRVLAAHGGTAAGRVRQGGVISAVAVGHRQAALAVMCRG